MIADDVLRQRQSLPLDAKIALSEIRIKEWYMRWHGDVYVSFSGGKDSTVLLHLVRRFFPQVRAMFIDSGLEYPEVREFVKGQADVDWVRPRKSFKQVVETYGYPLVSKEISQQVNEARNTKSEKLRAKRLSDVPGSSGRLSYKWRFLVDAPFQVSHLCCQWLKKEPSSRYEKETGRKPFVGTMASESSLRKQRYLRYGCNSFDTKRPMSTPLAFWKEEDVYAYIEREKLEISRIYSMGYERTGCMFCGFGLQYDGEESRFKRMAVTHPNIHEYVMKKLGMEEMIRYLGEHDGL